MSIKTFYIKTFGCQMNYADSEKIHMILMSAGLRKVADPVKADIVIMNTCSVRQKGEDRVFGFMKEISRFHKNNDTQSPLFGITGCMVRKSGMAKRYLSEFLIATKEKTAQKVADPSQAQDDKPEVFSPSDDKLEAFLDHMKNVKIDRKSVV